MGISTEPIHATAKRHAIYRAPVRITVPYALVKRHSQNHLASFRFSGLEIRCKPGEFAIFDPPRGLSCAAWANDFVDAFGGYLENPSDTQACRYCQYKASLT